MTVVRPELQFGVAELDETTGRAASTRSRGSTAGSTAASSASSRASLDYLERGQRARARAARAAGRRRRAARLPPRGLLGLHGHLQGRGAAQRPLGRRASRPGGVVEPTEPAGRDGARHRRARGSSAPGSPGAARGGRGGGPLRPRRVPALGARAAGIAASVDVVAATCATASSLARALDEHEVDAVFHLAAQTIVGTPTARRSRPSRRTSAGTWTLLEACRDGRRRARRRRLLRQGLRRATTSCPTREDFAAPAALPLRRLEGGDRHDRPQLRHTYGLPVAVTRLANLYGGGDLNFSRLIPETVSAVLDGRRPCIRSDGSPERDYLYVEDAVGAYLAIADALDDGGGRGEALNAGGGRPHSVREVVELIASLGQGRRTRHPGRGHPARRDRPPVPRLDQDPRACRLGAASGSAGGRQEDSRVVRRASRGAARCRRALSPVSRTRRLCDDARGPNGRERTPPASRTAGTAGGSTRCCRRAARSSASRAAPRPRVARAC